MPENRTPFLFMLSALTRVADAPVLVPDVEAAADEIDDPRPELVNLRASDPTETFLALRDLVDSGLVERTPVGYKPTADGEKLAEDFREQEPEVAGQLDKAAKAALS